jgi:hypothetical protein
MTVNDSLAPTITVTDSTYYVNAMLHPTWLEILSVTGIHETDAAAGLKIFPNPSNGVFHYVAPALVDDAVLNIFDVNGRCVNTSRISTGAHLLNLSGVANGVYLARIVSPYATLQQRILIER